MKASRAMIEALSPLKGKWNIQANMQANTKQCTIQVQGFHWLERSYMCVYTHTGIRERKEEGGGMEEVEDKMVGETWGHT